MNEIQIFNSPQFGEIRTTGTSDEPLFCLVDLCKALGIANARNVKARLDAEDVCQMDTLTNGGKQSLLFVNEAGMYDVILRSDSPSAKKFRKWVTSEVLPSIRKHGGYTFTAPTSAIQEKLQAASWAADFLHLTQASKLLMAQAILSPIGLPLPDYAPAEKSELTVHCATFLLKQHGVNLSALAFNKKLVEKGICTRQHRKGTKGKEHTWITLNSDFLDYGQNVVNPQNQQQTQVQWYDETFPTLLTKIGYEK